MGDALKQDLLRDIPGRVLLNIEGRYRLARNQSIPLLLLFLPLDLLLPAPIGLLGIAEHRLLLLVRKHLGLPILLSISIDSHHDHNTLLRIVAHVDQLIALHVSDGLPLLEPILQQYQDAVSGQVVA